MTTLLQRIPFVASCIALVWAIASGSACSSQTGLVHDGGGAGGPSGTGGSGGLAPINLDGSVPAGTLAIAPGTKAITVAYGGASPTVAFTCSVDGHSLPCSYTTDRGQIADVSSAGVLTPSGKVGGTVHVTATYQSQTATASVVVNVAYSDNGASGPQPDAGVGGPGGVGGEGMGPAVPAALKTVLDGSPTKESALAWLYPYDGTVWPRGLLSPLLQWSAPRNYDAVLIHIKEAAFEYKGYFGKTATPFAHHPIPQVAWDALGFSNAGEPVTVSLVFAANGVAYGPITETWTIAQGSLKGTVYYQSYGTALLANSGTIGANNDYFGAGTLAIKSGATDPVVVAGDNTHCRVCHSVSADGSRMITQESRDGQPFGFQYSLSDFVDLKQSDAVTSVTPATGTPDGRYETPALYPDGTFLLSDGAPLDGVEFAGDAQLFSVPSGASLPSSGIPTGLRMGSPMFSPDGKHVAFNYVAGPNSDQRSLAMMDFNVATHTFSNLQILFTPPTSPTFQMAVWPSFLPTNGGVVFDFRLQNDANNDWGQTRMGDGVPSIPSQGELWWVDLGTKKSARLDKLNGRGYLPTRAATNHTDDTILNYEPTVNVIASGGYAWVVFTTRRLYGNVATVDPYASDPRNVDLTTTITTKKLWVAAFDLNPTPGADPSHPAFYLPGQELHAGNSRGYWVVDPCQATGAACVTGDECCGGYCRNAPGGSVCADQASGCANEYEKCTNNADCCNSSDLSCVGGRCAVQIIVH